MDPRTRSRQAGQGMSEYLIIVALVAVAAIAMVGFFGDTIRAQFYNMTAALAGSSNTSKADKFVNMAKKEVNKKGMADFQP